MTVIASPRNALPPAETAHAVATAAQCSVLGRIGTLETRLAGNDREVRAAQRIRYQVFREGIGTRFAHGNTTLGHDADAYDAICDHIVVCDTALAGNPDDRIVGTYRVLRDDIALRCDGFYSASEFDIDPLLERHPCKRFMELGRSCVLPAYRTRRTLELLWQGNWAYARRHRVDAMFGCASFAGLRPEAHALALAFLHHHHRARDEWAVSAHRQLMRNMDLMPQEAISPRQGLAALPPLIKGYLRLGAMVGTGAVVDPAFGTTDIFIILPVSRISGRYLSHYGVDASRFAS